MTAVASIARKVCELRPGMQVSIASLGLAPVGDHYATVASACPKPVWEGDEIVESEDRWWVFLEGLRGWLTCPADAEVLVLAEAFEY